MSIDIMNRIWWRQDLAMLDKIVALALADHAHDDGFCYPAVATLALKCSCTDRSIQNALKSLTGKQLLRKMERTGRSSYFQFVLDNLPHVERPRRINETSPMQERDFGYQAGDLFDNGGESRSKRGGEPRSDGVNLVPKGGESHVKGGEPASPRIIIEPSIETPLSDSGDFKSPIVVSEGGNPVAFVEPSLVQFVAASWAVLKSKHDGIAQVRKIDDGLKHTIELRGKQHANEGETGFDVWREFFARVDASLFLQGRAPPGRDRDQPFKLSLGWAMKAANFREILNGKYDTTRAPTSHDHRGQRLAPADQAHSQAVRDFRESRGRSPKGRDRGADHR